MIPIKKVYYSFIGNSVIDLENLNGDKATSYEKKMYRKIQTLEDQAINVSKKSCFERYQSVQRSE